MPGRQDFNRRLREEQDREFEASLAADRAREEAAAAAAAEAEAEAEAAEAAARAAQEAEQQKASLREAKAAALSAQPPAGPGVTTLLVRLSEAGVQKEGGKHIYLAVHTHFTFIGNYTITLVIKAG